MGPADDDGAVDPQPHPDAGDGGSFDPGLETGYLRRAPRDRELSPELGAEPFDPGPERYDDRRARRQAKRRGAGTTARGAGAPQTAAPAGAGPTPAPPLAPPPPPPS